MSDASDLHSNAKLCSIHFLTIFSTMVTSFSILHWVVLSPVTKTCCRTRFSETL